MEDLRFRIERDSSSGKLHKRYADEFGRFELTREQCQRDQSGAYVVVERGGPLDRGDGVPVGTPRSDLCKYDFPDLSGD